MWCFNKIKRIKILWRFRSRYYSVAAPKVTSKQQALNHFDQLYGLHFKNWPSIRLALLCPHSYCAILNPFTESSAEFIEALGTFSVREAYYENVKKIEESNLKKTLEEFQETPQFRIVRPEFPLVPIEPQNLNDEGYVHSGKLMGLSENESEYYVPPVACEVTIAKERTIEFPKNVEAYMFPRGKYGRFPQPDTDATDLFNYYLMDGASLLPVIALDIKENDEIGDLCAAPGGKSLAIAFGLNFGKLVCNDASLSRYKRLQTVLNSYLPAIDPWNKKILVSNIDVCTWKSYEIFDKVLLDVPCTNDRLSVTKDGNNIFKTSRYSERIQLPHLQSNMLCKALMTLKPGGDLVYSTCSLSPYQNDNVVHLGLSKIAEESGMEFHVKDLSGAFAPFKDMFLFSESCQFGQLIVPFLPLNYGPMYISKITRVK